MGGGGNIRQCNDFFLLDHAVVGGGVFIAVVSTWQLSPPSLYQRSPLRSWPSHSPGRRDMGLQRASALPRLPLPISDTVPLRREAGDAKVLIVLMKMANTSFPSGSTKGEAVWGAITHH